MNNPKVLIGAICMGFIVSCDDLNNIQVQTELTQEEVVAGLRMALSVGADTSVAIQSAENGYFGDDRVKILLPQEASGIINNIAKIPGGTVLLDQTVLAVNRAAEDAAVEARPIFIEAIENITIEDGFAILNGANDAATNFLISRTSTELGMAFSPKIANSLGKKLVGNVSAESAYAALIEAYNKASLNGLLFPEVRTNSLTAHTTEKALDGLFQKVAVEEGRIRTDASHRVNEILRRVFGT